MQLKPLLRYLLLSPLDTEPDATNVIMLLNALCVYVFEEHSHGFPIIGDAVKCIIECVVMPAQRPPEVRLRRGGGMM